MSKIAILGLGAMGSRMARSLIQKGHDVVVYNRTAERVTPLVAEGARSAGTPREAAEGADVVIGMVTDDRASAALWLDERTGAASALGADTIAIESSTLTPGWVHELAGVVAARGAAFLDAPVVGSRPQAEAAALIYLVGGPLDALERARGILAAMGSAIHHVGPVGAGTVMKLAVNGLFGIQVAALAEMLGMVERAGLDRARVVELLGSMPVTSPALKGIGGLMAARAFAPMFPIDLVEKDFGYIVATAQRLGAATPTAAAVRAVYAQAQQQGHGSDNIAAVAQMFA